MRGVLADINVVAHVDALLLIWVTAEKILDYLMRIDEVRGSGRIYVP
jgi:hypothetical protein